MRRSGWICAALLLLLAAAPALAQLAGSVSGLVTGEDGGPLPGVSVTLSGPALQGTRTAVTKADGTFLFPNVPPGADFKAVYAISGFQGVEKQGFAVRTGIDSQVNAVLKLAAVGTEVTVTAENPVVDVTRGNTQATFPADYLRKVTIGSAGRDYLSVLSHGAGVVGTGNPNVLGGNIQQNSFTIDGVNTTDPTTHTFTALINFDAIQEVSVQTSSFEAQYGRASGGIVNVVTKSGGNDFHATGDFRYSTNEFSEKGEFFDPKVTETKQIQPSFTFGGPVLRDRLWFFANYERPYTSRQPTTTDPVVAAQNPSAPSREFTGDNYGIKLTFTASPTVNGQLLYNDSPATIENAENSVLIRPEAAATQEQQARILKAKVNALASASILVEGSVGRFTNTLDRFPTNGDLSASRWQNQTGGNVRYDSYNLYDSTTRKRTLASVAGTYFLSDLVGNHQIKVGADGDKTSDDRLVFTTGTPSDASFCPAGKTCGATFIFRGFDAAGNRIPFQQTVSERQGATPRDGYSYALYLQDQWRPTTRLTLNLGLRYDRSLLDNNQGERVVDFHKLQPRLAASFDVFGDGKGVVRASYGQFYDEPGLTLVRLLSSGVVTGITRTYSWVPATSSWTLVRQSGGTVNPSGLIDPAIKPTYEEHINVAFEREVLPGTTASVTYVYKKAHDIYEDTCINVDCDDFWVTNNPGAAYGLSDVLRRDYYGYVFEARKTFQRGMAAASYVYSKSRGSVDSSDGQFGGVDFDHNPENFVNRYGFLTNDAPHQVKVFASYQVPWIETNVAANYTYRSGVPYNVTRTDPTWGAVFVEARGANRTEPQHVLDLQLEKQFRVGPLGLSIIGSVFNVLDEEAATTYGTGIESAATYKRPLTYTRPRNYQVGARVEF